MMSVIDDYITTVDLDKQSALERIRKIGHEIVPNAEEALSYGMPALKTNGKAFLGFNANEKHIGIYPMSGSIVEKMKDQLTMYETAKGSIKVPLNQPISEALLKQLIGQRLEEINKK